MPLDERLRDTFDRASHLVEPDVERHLAAIEGSRVRRPGAPVGTLLVASIVVLVLLPVIQGVAGRPAPVSPPVATAGPSLPGVAAISGTYVIDIDASEPVASGVSLAGDWTMTLRPNGVIDVIPPADFAGSRATGHAYSVDGDAFRTDLWFNDECGSVGTYRWSKTDGALTLTVVDDDCAIRRAVLGTRPWSTAP